MAQFDWQLKRLPASSPESDAICDPIAGQLEDDKLWLLAITKLEWVARTRCLAGAQKSVYLGALF